MDDYRATYPEYEGKAIWEVSHPDHTPSIRVRAPNTKNHMAAIITAATVWKRRWQEIDFYADCTVFKV